jgi:hypothetical protein
LKWLQFGATTAVSGRRHTAQQPLIVNKAQRAPVVKLSGSSVSDLWQACVLEWTKLYKNAPIL